MLSNIGEKKMENLDIRLYVKESGLMFKEVAEQMGITDVHLSRVLKNKLKPDMRNRILNAINELRGDGDE